MPNYSILTPPASEPVTLADAKDWLKIDGTDDDKLISALIVSARLAVEAATGLFLIAQRWRLNIDAWPQSGRLTLAHAPLQSIIALRIYDANGTPQICPTSSLSYNSARDPKLQVQSTIPQPGKSFGGIEIDLAFGFGETASSVPEDLKLAIKMLVAFWHENRGDDGTGAALRWPEAISALLHPYLPRRV